MNRHGCESDVMKKCVVSTLRNITRTAADRTENVNFPMSTTKFLVTQPRLLKYSME